MKERGQRAYKRDQQVNKKDCMRQLLPEQSSWSQCPGTSLQYFCCPSEQASKTLAHLYYKSQDYIHTLSEFANLF